MTKVATSAQRGNFDPAWYLETYPDVAISGIDPYEHFQKIGSLIGRRPSPDYLGNNTTIREYANTGKWQNTAKVARPTYVAELVQVDVVVPVFNALPDVRRCLFSIMARKTGCDVRVLVVNDCSDAQTTKWLHTVLPELRTSNVRFELIEHEENLGYTKAVNSGLRASKAPYVVLLNSDTIVTTGWLDGMFFCMSSAQEIGIVGPLSNAASWQNVPELYDGKGHFAINGLSDFLSAEGMAHIVREVSNAKFPRTTFVNGFCFMISRKVLDAIGVMDEVAFPVGYGEENDFCIRAMDAGFSLAYADHTYVFHAKSKSFGTERRLQLSKSGSDALKKKHGADKVNSLIETVKKTEQMDEVRQRVQNSLNSRAPSIDPTEWVVNQRVLFVLPVAGGSGGAHSVIQEVSAMRRLGVEAKVAVREQDYDGFLNLYQDIENAADLFVSFHLDDLAKPAQDFDVVVGTINSSMNLVRDVVLQFPWILPAYYAQDYEPMFFAEGSQDWDTAMQSYDLIPDAIVFAKTKWIGQQIEDRHCADVFKVAPSIDHSVYFPKSVRQAGGRACVTAMIRPQTPRRGADRTMQLLGRLKEQFGSSVYVKIFGCDSDHPAFAKLQRSFEYENLGVLNRPQVARLLQEADIFIDMSDYQAFGRTALEAMACNTVVVVPSEGGADEYAIQGGNALVLDTTNVDECFREISALLSDAQAMSKMRLAGLKTASSYSLHRAALSELTIFASALARHRAVPEIYQRPRVVLAPALTQPKPDRSITGSGFVRLVRPYIKSALYSDFRLQLSEEEKLPSVDTTDVTIIQRDLCTPLQSEFLAWSKNLKANGGKIIYEVDDDFLDADGLRSRGFSGDTDSLQKRVKMYAEAADLITVSTDMVAAAFSNHAHKVRVVPNYIDDELWGISKVRTAPDKKCVKTPEQRVRIGYFGTPSHLLDLKMVQGAMTRIQQTYGKELDIEIVGVFQDTEALFGRRVGLPKNRTYPQFVSWIRKLADWDIAIIPLVDDSFNRAKSNLKFLECAALDAAIVCSTTSEYMKVGRQGENCLFVQNNTESWERALVTLIEDADLRRSLSETARRDVAQKFTIQTNYELYRSILNSVLDR